MWDFEVAVEPVEVVRIGVKWRFLDLQESCRVRRRKVLDTVAKAVRLVDELVKPGGKRGALVMNIFVPIALLSEGPEVVLL